MEEPARVLVIGLDAAEPSLLQEWSDAGKLPAIARLRESGPEARIVNPPGLYTGATWTSFFTAVSPGRHGRYFGRQIVPGTYRVDKLPAATIKYDPFWRRLSDAGRRVAVVDVPNAPLCNDFNGIQVLDWGTHGPEGPDVRSWPPGLADQVIQRFGRDTLRSCDAADRDAEDFRLLRDRIIDRIERKTEIACHFLDQGRWDLFCVGFADSHCAGHQFWHLHDPGHPSHDPAMAADLGNPLKDVYIALDRAIGRILDRAGPQAVALLYTSHGMGSGYSCTFLLDEILRRLDDPDTRRSSGLKAGLLGAYRNAVPAGVRTALRPLFKPLHGPMDSVDDAVTARDRRNRTCFVLPTNEDCGAIRLNLVGREPNGRIRSGPECETFCASLAADLRSVVDVETGRPIVEAVLRCADVFQGEALGDLPDLIVSYKLDQPIAGVRSPKIGELRRRSLETRSGDHRPEGLLLACGPGIASGRHADPVSVTDLGPTICAHLGVDLPGVDGAPIEALLAQPA